MTVSSKNILVVAMIACFFMPLVSAAQSGLVIVAIDKHGDPIEGVDIDIKNSTGNKFDEDTTDDDGEAEFDLDEDDDYDIIATHNDYQDFENTNDVLKDFDSDTDLVIVMRPKAVDLLVHVVDSDDEDIKNVEVTVECIEEDLDDEDFEDDYDPDEFVYPDEENKYEAFDYDETEDTDSNGEAEFKDIESDTRYKITLKKSGYPTVTQEIELDLNEDEDVEITMIEPGTATFTAIVREQGTNDLVSGATVTVVRKSDSDRAEKATGADGKAVFTLETPACYDVAVTKDGFGTDSQTNLCLDNNDNINAPYYIESENNAPTADAGAARSVLVGDQVVLDGSGSSDPDGDTLTYTWADSLGEAIPDGVAPTVTFAIAGEHTITLTVSDGTATATDTTTVYVDSPQNCGDGVCSRAERELGTCPEDCPVCDDDVCGAGEALSGTEEYCPIDCGVVLGIALSNTSALVSGNTTVISAVDPNTGDTILGTTITVTAPNGSVTELIPVMGRAEYTFDAAGEYEIAILSDDYVSDAKTVNVASAGVDVSGLLLPAAIVIVVIIVALFVIRYMNTRGKGGGSAGGKGYRAKKYRRGKSTLSSI